MIDRALDARALTETVGCHAECCHLRYVKRKHVLSRLKGTGHARNGRDQVVRRHRRAMWQGRVATGFLGRHCALRSGFVNRCVGQGGRLVLQGADCRVGRWSSPCVVRGCVFDCRGPGTCLGSQYEADYRSAANKRMHIKVPCPVNASASSVKHTLLRVWNHASGSCCIGACCAASGITRARLKPGARPVRLRWLGQPFQRKRRVCWPTERAAVRVVTSAGTDGGLHAAALPPGSPPRCRSVGRSG